ncbi:ABC transporter ATP-binding protein [Micromonospora musae]|uniref:ABC transporter ATP-binding protein n=1 Tax=Micromonospora musae TaxID=1894970 RepID=UPI0034414A33
MTKLYGTGVDAIVAANDVTVNIEPSSITAITGASGSGKSTLLHLIGAIEAPDKGRIRVGKKEITSVGTRGLVKYRRTLGFVFQRYHLLPTLSALDNVIAPVLPFRTTFDKAARGREMLDLVGLGGRENALPGQLSGGQQQRVAIARALVGQPTLLLADEPTGSLDSVTCAATLDLLIRIRAEFGMTMLIATHEQDVAALADRRLHVRDGRIVQDIVADDSHEGKASVEAVAAD